MTRLILIIAVCLYAMPGAFAQNCTEISHTFSSGANWRACANTSEQYGLSLTDVHYFAPGDSARLVARHVHPAQLSLTEHGASNTEFLIGSNSQHSVVRLDQNTCDGNLIALDNGSNLCTVVRPLPLLAKYSTRSALQGEALDVFAVSAHGSLIWRSNIRLTEDGRIKPSINFSGLRSFGMRGDSGGATLQSTWRMAFAINGVDNNRVEQFDFPLNRAAGNRRAMEVTPIETESLLTVARDDFRGWRVIDQNGSGYYLDPQNSGYQTVSSQFNWAKFDLAVTAFNPCEELAHDNAAADCENTLDGFVNGESLDGASPVLWYTQSRVYRPRTEDQPVISSLVTEFELLPFEWTASSPFEAIE